MRLGVSRRQAIRHWKSRKGYWQMAKTIASGVGMPNPWLQEQALVSLKSLWASLAPRLLSTTSVEPPGADPHAVVVRAGRLEMAALTRFMSHLGSGHLSERARFRPSS